MATQVSTSSPRESRQPLRVGICCGPGPSAADPNGDALAGLVGGLLTADPRPEITLLLPTQEQFPRLRERWGPGVRLISAVADQSGEGLPWPARAWRRARAGLDRAAHVLACAWSRVVHVLKRQAALELRGELQYWRTCRRNGAFVVLFLHLPGVLLLLTGLAACAWAASVVSQLAFG